MTTTDIDRHRVVIPDTAEALPLAERFGRFLALGASKSSGVGIADTLARDPEMHRVEQRNSSRSALPAIQNEVGSRADTPHPDLELGVDHEHTVSVTGAEAEAADAHVEPDEGIERDQGGDQLCISY